MEKKSIRMQRFSSRPFVLSNNIKTGSLVVSGAIWINTLRDEQKDSHFADNILKGIFLNESCCILILISLKIIHNGPVDKSQHWLRLWFDAQASIKLSNETAITKIFVILYGTTRLQWVKNKTTQTICFMKTQITAYHFYLLHTVPEIIAESSRDSAGYYMWLIIVIRSAVVILGQKHLIFYFMTDWPLRSTY